MTIYATVSNVQAIAPKRTFSATSIPNLLNVVQYLEHAQAEVDGYLGADGYLVPVPTTATISLKLLERIVTSGAWAMVEQAAQTSEDVERAIKAWNEQRANLQRGLVQLVDAPRLGGESFARAQFAATAFFTRDMQF